MKVKLFANFREICGDKTVHLPFDQPQPVVNLLEALIEKYPPMEEELFTPDKELKPLVHVLINGKNIVHHQGLQTIVHPSDEISLFPPVAGG